MVCVVEAFAGELCRPEKRRDFPIAYSHAGVVLYTPPPRPLRKHRSPKHNDPVFAVIFWDLCDPECEVT